MILTFILGALAGVGAVFAEGALKDPLSSLNLTAMELRLIAFALCLLVAALLSAVIGNGGGIALTLGAVVGVFVPKFLGR